MKASDKSERVRCADCKWLGREYTCWVCTNPSCTAQSIVPLQRMNRRMVLASRVCFSFSSTETSMPILSADDVRLLHGLVQGVEKEATGAFTARRLPIEKYQLVLDRFLAIKNKKL